MQKNIQNNNLFSTSLHLIFVIIAYPLIFYPFNFSLVRDSLLDLFPNFLYLANSLLHGFKLPLWSSWEGGIPIGITSMSFFHVMPHRLVGYLLYTILPFNPFTMFKASLVIGMMFIGVGWWLCLVELTKSKFSATFGCLMLLWGGTGISVIHQEQIISTMTWWPWILLALMQIKKNFNYVLVLAILVGFTISAYYPHLGLLAFIFLLLSLTITGKANWLLSKKELTPRKIYLLIAGIFLFLLAASPAIYTKTAIDDFSSPVRSEGRNSEEIGAVSYKDYVSLNRQQLSSAPFNYLLRYFMPAESIHKYSIPAGDPQDSHAFFVSIIGLILAALGLISRRKAALPVVIVLIFGVWAALGINAYLPQLLFIIRFPFIGLFRQWYHFFPLVNLSLSALGALGFSALINSSKIKKKYILLLGMLVFVVLGYECKNHYSSYLERIPHTELLMPHPKRGEYIVKFEKKEFLYWIKGGKKNVHTLYVYKEWDRLNKASAKEISKVPFSTNIVYNDTNISSSSSYKAMKKILDSPLSSYAVLATIPSAVAINSNMSIQNLSTDNNFPSSDLKNNQMNDNIIKNNFFSENNYTITPAGVHLTGNAQTPCLVVFPFSFKLGFKTYLNGQRMENYPVYGGGMTGVFVPKGKFDITLDVPLSWYQITLLIQAMLLIFILLFVYKTSFSTMLSKENENYSMFRIHATNDRNPY